MVDDDDSWVHSPGMCGRNFDDFLFEKRTSKQSRFYDLAWYKPDLSEKSVDFSQQDAKGKQYS